MRCVFVKKTIGRGFKEFMAWIIYETITRDYVRLSDLGDRRLAELCAPTDEDLDHVRSCMKTILKEEQDFRTEWFRMVDADRERRKTPVDAS